MKILSRIGVGNLPLYKLPNWKEEGRRMNEDILHFAFYLLPSIVNRGLFSLQLLRTATVGFSMVLSITLRLGNRK